MEKPSQRGLAYLLLSLPLIVGLLFPTVSLDTTIVEAKGFNFPVSKESVGDPDMQTQYLKPDTSMYFNKTDYDKQMAKAMKQYDGQSVISITDENYLEIMELIYNYPSQFAGKRISYKGFVYNSKREESVDQFVFRFGIIHCVADSGVFGLLVHFPEHTQFQNNDWVTITGTVELSYYPPFKRQIPTVQVEKVKADQAPKINMSIVPFKKVGCFLIKWKQPTFLLSIFNFVALTTNKTQRFSFSRKLRIF